MESVAGLEEIVHVLFTLAIGVGSGVLANHISNVLTRQKPKTISIERTEIEFENGKISRLISEILKINDN